MRRRVDTSTVVGHVIAYLLLGTVLLVVAMLCLRAIVWAVEVLL